MRDDLVHGAGGAQRFVLAVRELEPVSLTELRDAGIDDAGHWLRKIKRDGGIEQCGFEHGRGQLWRLTW